MEYHIGAQGGHTCTMRHRIGKGLYTRAVRYRTGGKGRRVRTARRLAKSKEPAHSTARTRALTGRCRAAKPKTQDTVARSAPHFLRQCAQYQRRLRGGAPKATLKTLLQGNGIKLRQARKRRNATSGVSDQGLSPSAPKKSDASV